MTAPKKLERKRLRRCLMAFTHNPHAITERLEIVRYRLHSVINLTVIRVRTVPDRIEPRIQTLAKRRTGRRRVVATVELQSFGRKPVDIRRLHIRIPVAPQIRVGHVICDEEQKIRTRLFTRHRNNHRKQQTKENSKHNQLQKTHGQPRIKNTLLHYYLCLLPQTQTTLLAQRPNRVASTGLAALHDVKSISRRLPHRNATLCSYWMETCIPGRGCRPFLL